MIRFMIYSLVGARKSVALFLAHSRRDVFHEAPLFLFPEVHIITRLPKL